MTQTSFGKKNHKIFRPKIQSWAIQKCLPAALAISLGVAAATPASVAHAQQVIQSERTNFRLIQIADRLSNPWGMAFLPDGRILVTERRGRLRMIENGQLLNDPIVGVPDVASTGQGGLLDITLHPDFAQNGLLYLSHAGTNAAGGSSRLGTQVTRARFDGTRLTDLALIFDQEPKSRGGRHFGSRVRFIADGSMIVTLGDRGDRDRAQDLSDLAGKTVRLRDDGSIPADNPFANRAGVRPEIFTYGNRNGQGLAIHPTTGLPWQHEHGPQGGDEVNILQPGKNYGWPVITYGENYGGGRIGEGTTKSGMEQPLYYWDPSIAPSGMAFYSGDKFPAWKGDLFVGALKYQLLVRLELDGNRIVGEERLLARQIGRIRDVRQGPDGYLYILTDSSRGGLYRLEPTQ